ncbi:MAG: rRNA maturation RNase YbeY [Planctomycetota bacterium]
MSELGVERVAVADLQERSVDLEALQALAHTVLLAEGDATSQLSLAVVDDPHMSELHERFSGVPGPTDVLSFPLADEHVPLLGEVIVSSDTAALEAEERGLPFEEELQRYVVHGILHLFGYDDHDPEDRTRMHARQERLLSEFRGAPGS